MNDFTEYNSGVARARSAHRSEPIAARLGRVNIAGAWEQCQNFRASDSDRCQQCLRRRAQAVNRMREVRAARRKA